MANKGKGVRRPKGTGSILVDAKTGKADAEIKLLNRDGSERRERKRLASEDEAERWLRQIRYEHEQGFLLSQEASRLTVGNYLNAWLKDSVAGTVSRHTQRDYEDKVRLHINPALGKIRLTDLTTQHLNRFYRKKLTEGQSPRSVRYMHTTMGKAAEGRA